jgi:putative ABC transport system ATP-binding protein
VLLEEITVVENVCLADRAAGRPVPSQTEAILERLEIDHLARRGGYEISVGERQRTMVARALAGEPKIVLADEPVAHQDVRRAELVLQLLRERANAGAAVLIATRDEAIASVVDRVLEAPFTTAS